MHPDTPTARNSATSPSPSYPSSNKRTEHERKASIQTKGDDEGHRFRLLSVISLFTFVLQLHGKELRNSKVFTVPERSVAFSGASLGQLQKERMVILKGTSSACRVIALSVLLLSLVSGAWAQFTIPDRYDGFVYNAKPEKGRGPVLWEVFIDPLCIDCKLGWPAVKQVAERYGSALLVIVHPFPAPFHHNAYFAARALHVAQAANASLVYPLLELVFENQESFLNPNTNHETPAHVVSRFVSLASELGVSANTFEAGFNDSGTDQATRISFKYGCSRGVVGTPTYLVNGVNVAGADDSWSVDDWAKIFDPIVKATGLGMTYPSS